MDVDDEHPRRGVVPAGEFLMDLTGKKTGILGHAPRQRRPGGHYARMRIYVVDDDPVVSLFIQKVLSREETAVRLFSEPSAALRAVAESAPDLLLTDLQMEGMDGFSLLSAAKDLAPQLPVIVVTGSDKIHDALRAIRLGAADYVTKTFDPAELCEVVDRTMRIAKLEAQNRRQTAELEARDAHLRKELDLAREIHRALLPGRLPEIEGLRFGLLFLPSGEVGGDFYDFVRFEDPLRIGVVLSDISGHGVPAALLFAMFKAIAGEVFAEGKPPGESLTLLNRKAARAFPAGRFASTFFCVLDARARSLTYAKASQEPGVLLRGGRAILLEEGGPPLGAFDPDVFGEAEFPERSLGLESGDMLFLYTDGWVELEDAQGSLLGMEGLLVWLGEEMRPSPGPSELLEALRGRAERRAGGSGFRDDLTAIAIQVR